MRILAIYRHYWPDSTPYARILRSILESAARDDHSVDVFTAQPGYNDLRVARQQPLEHIEGVTIRRVSVLPERKHLFALRFLNFVYFLLRAVIHAVLVQRYDAIIANSHPPILTGLVLHFIRLITGTRYVYHVQDLHPECALNSGILKSRRFANLLQKLDRTSCERAFRVVTLSEDMRQSIVDRGGENHDNIIVINNFALEQFEQPGPVPSVFNEELSHPFRVLFAGNMGRFQHLDCLVEAAFLLQDEPQIQFIFMGAGVERKRLEQLAGPMIGQSVHFVPHCSVETAFECMRRSDLGVVSLQPEIFRVAYPSKTMTYLAAGCPVLALVERNSQIARDIIQNEFGTVPDLSTPYLIAQEIRTCFQTREKWTPLERHNLTERSLVFYGRETALRHWLELWRSIERELATEQKLASRLTPNWRSQDRQTIQRDVV